MNVSPDELANVVQGATPVQIATLILVGVIAVAAVIAIVKWVVDLKTGSLPMELRKLTESVAQIQMQLAEVKLKLWSHEEIDREIERIVQQHELKYHNSKED